MHFPQQKDPKARILTLSSALIKICQIQHFIFQTRSQLPQVSSFSNFLSLFSVRFRSNVIYFAQKE